jgi:hypothetical protein
MLTSTRLLLSTVPIFPTEIVSRKPRASILTMWVPGCRLSERYSPKALDLVCVDNARVLLGDRHLCVRYRRVSRVANRAESLARAPNLRLRIVRLAKFEPTKLGSKCCHSKSIDVI